MVATYSIQVYRTRYFTLVGRVVNTLVVRTGIEPVILASGTTEILYGIILTLPIPPPDYKKVMIGFLTTYTSWTCPLSPIVQQSS